MTEGRDSALLRGLVGGAGVEPATSPVLVSGRSTALSYPPAFVFFVMRKSRGRGTLSFLPLGSDMIVREDLTGVKVTISTTLHRRCFFH